MIEPFIRALDRAGVQADDRELAEILWLSRFVSGPVTVTPPQILEIEPEQPPASTTPPIPSPGSEHQTERPISLPPADTTPVYSVSLTGAGSQPRAGRKVRVSGAAALPAALDIARALRPFSRRFPSRQRLVFDEAATVRNAADGGPLTPICRPAMERWFEVALVVEDTPSMAVWQQTIAELQRLLAGHGAFRDVQRWRFRTTGVTIQLLSRAGVTRNVQQLKDPGGRRLILVVSDCVSPGWRDGAMAAVVAQWGASMPVAIVQMLPETLWRHTALSSYNVSLRAVLPGVPNKHLAVTRPWWDIEPLEGSVPVPVVTLEPKVVSAWAGMVMAAGVSFSGVLLGSSASPEAVETSPPAAEKPLEPQERVQLFRDLASRQAFQLAVYLTAVPLTLPVMRLVQRTMFMLPEYRQVHLAEVFLGGLLERVTPADVRCSPEEVEYDFYEGVWEILTKSILRSEANKVLAAITHYIEDHTGKPFDFEALLPDSEGEEALPAFARPFARVGAEFIKRLGKPPRLVKGGVTGVQRVADQPIPFRDPFLDSKTDGPEMVWLPGGTFTMGDDKSNQSDEKPTHPVTLSHFAVGKYPVTFEEYDAFCEANKRKKPEDRGWGWGWGRGRRPVIYVSWDDAQAYCQWLTGQTGREYRLLTEAQWEYACRVGSDTAWCFGDDKRQLGDYAWYWDNSEQKTHPVGEKRVNAWGLHDLHGNVWEWVQDWYGSYSSEHQHDPSGPESGAYRVIRGGSWYDVADHCRSAFRDYWNDPADRDRDLGFRLARTGALHSYPFTLGPESEPKSDVQAESETEQKPTYQHYEGFRDRLKSGTEAPEMVYLPGGTFKMGDIQGKGHSDEKPVHEVTLDAFAIGRYPVTVGEFRRFVEAKSYRTEAEREGRAYVWDGLRWAHRSDANWREPCFPQDDRHPVVCISWNDAAAYCEWLSEQTGERYSLPTEAEWEYACRASSETAYFFGDDKRLLEEYAWYSKNSEWRTHPVGEKRANPWGLYDISGNVWEWVRDWYEHYPEEPQHNPSGPKTGGDRVIRGGSWNRVADDCRSAFRSGDQPGSRVNNLGFRLARRV